MLLEEHPPACNPSLTPSLPPAPPAGTPANLLAEAVRAAMQLHCEAGQAAQALAHLEQQLPALRSAQVLHADMEGLWATAVAGAAAARDPLLLQQALAAAQAWAAEADDDSPAFRARLLGLQAAASLAAQQAHQAAAQYSCAVHIHPSSVEARLGLAAAVLARPGSGASQAEATLRLLDSPAIAAAVARGERATRVAPGGQVGRAASPAVCDFGMSEQGQRLELLVSASSCWQRVYDPRMPHLCCAACARGCGRGRHRRRTGSSTLHPRAAAAAPVNSSPLCA